jgi:hypothetical protein
MGAPFRRNRPSAIRKSRNPGRGVLGGIDVEEARRHDPDLAVEPPVDVVWLLAETGGERVGGVGGVVGEAHGEDVVARDRGPARVEDEPREGAAMLAEVGAVHVDVGEGGRALEDEIERAAGVLARHDEAGAIPRAAPRALSPGVGNRHRLPRAIVEARRLRALEVVARVEAPRAREQDGLPLAGRRLPRRRRRGSSLPPAAGRRHGQRHEHDGEGTPQRRRPFFGRVLRP